MVLHCCPSIPIPKPLLTLTHRRKPKPKFSCFVVPDIGVDDIAQLAHNKVLVAAAASAAIGQLSKPFTSVLYGKDFDFKTAFQAGGFPSTHSSSVVAAATSLALERGFSDLIFGVTLVYAGLVMYDAQQRTSRSSEFCGLESSSHKTGVRREVGNHAKVLNAILAKRQVNSVVSEDRDNLIDSREETSESAGNYEDLGPISSKKSRSLASKTANVSLLIAPDKETRQSFEFAGDDCEVLDRIRLKESIGHTEVEVVAGGLLGFIVSLAVYSIIV